MKSKIALLDTGPLLAFISKSDQYHLWAARAFKKLPPKLLTTEAVLSETFFLLRRSKPGIRSIATMLRQGLIRCVSMTDEIPAVIDLIEKYQSVPMSYADATLVRLAELSPQGIVVTLDSDFSVYRIRGKQRIPLFPFKS